jgi:hypothetical protein
VEETLTPVRTMVVSFDGSGKPVPRYSNGYLLFFDPDSLKV